MLGGGGGIVEEGVGEVKARTRAVATASAYVLNSATGVMLPSTSIAPPFHMISCLNHQDRTIRTHNNDLLDLKEGLGVLRGSKCQVS